MITFEHVTITYAGCAEPVLRDVDLTIAAGELCLVVGTTGSGKSTLLGAINGLVPHFTGGTLVGRVTVDGRDTATQRPRDLADVVGVVTQDPLAGCVTDSLEEELAYAMEQLAIAPSTMRKRVEEVLDVLGLATVARPRAVRAFGRAAAARRDRRRAHGQPERARARRTDFRARSHRRRGSARPRCTRLVHDLGITVVMAEHRLERVVQYADRMVFVDADGHAEHGDPQVVLAHATIAPPIVELGRAAGWLPLPLAVRDAWQAASTLRARLKSVTPPLACAPAPGVAPEVVLRARGVVVCFGAVVAVRDVDLDLHAGEVVALMGRNGAGKSSLLWAIQGAGARAAAASTSAATIPASSRRRGRARSSASCPTRRPTCSTSTASATSSGKPTSSRPRHPEPRERISTRSNAGIADDTHPRDLSEGQRLALVLAIQLTAEPRVMLLDEPTRGLDYDAKRALAGILAGLAARGHAIVVSTHDVEFVAASTHRVVVLADGEIVADGPTADVIVASPAYAPQVAKIVAPHPWLTVDQLERAGLFALDGAPS